MLIRNLLLLPLCALFAFGQSTASKAAPKKHRELPAQNINVYTDPWDTGEIKECVTFSGKPYLLVCSDTKVAWPGSLINLVGDNVATGMSEDSAYERAFTTATTRSKEFMVKFFDDHGRNPEPWPKPQTGRRMATWHCTKNTTISCAFGARQEN